MVLFPTANCRSILTSNTLCSTNLRTPSPQSPPRSSVQKEGKIETKQLGEAWPKKTGRQIMVKGGHHEERHAFSKQHFTTWAQAIQTFPRSFPTQNPPCATTFEETNCDFLEPPAYACLRNMYIGGGAQLPPLYAILSVTPLRSQASLRFRSRLSTFCTCFAQDSVRSR